MLFLSPSRSAGTRRTGVVGPQPLLRTVSFLREASTDHESKSLSPPCSPRPWPKVRVSTCSLCPGSSIPVLFLCPPGHVHLGPHVKNSGHVTQVLVKLRRKPWLQAAPLSFLLLIEEVAVGASAPDLGRLAQPHLCTLAIRPLGPLWRRTPSHEDPAP